MLEIGLVILSKMSAVAGMFAIIGTAAYLLSAMLAAAERAADNAHDTGCQDFFKRVKRYWVFLAILGIIGAIPSVDEVYKIRISLIKYELSSPENVVKATATIERIGEKLECKYLGCEKDEKTK